MADLNVHVHGLVELGLTRYEAKAYLTLIQRESYAASELAIEAGIPRQRIYDVLNSLVSRGLARDWPGPVTRYAATDPAGAIEGLLTVPDDKGVERLVARVANVRDLGHVNDWHLMVFNDKKEVFESVQRWDIHEGHDSAHPFRARVDDVEYYYLYPNWRVKADLKSLFDLKNYEALTCVAGDGKLRG